MDFLSIGAGAVAGYIAATHNQRPTQDPNKKGASVLVLSCIDPRFSDNLAWFLIHDKKLHDDYDLVCLAGASLGVLQTDFPSWRQTFIDHVHLAVSLHHIEEIWVFDHLDCGMYKATYDLESDLDPAIHVSTMDDLKAVLAEDFPSLAFKGFILDKDGTASRHL